MESLILLVFGLVLASFLGFELIAKVPSQLHTPLMSGSNAISGITIVGAIISLLIVDFSTDGTNVIPGLIIGTCAVFFATINVVGGYVVTNRMLSMFTAKKKEDK